MATRSTIALDAALHLLKPLVRHLLRHGVAYPVFASKVKQVFLDAAKEELQSGGKSLTDSAVSLLSGVHRRDVRNLTRPADVNVSPPEKPMNMATQVVARWLSETVYQDDVGRAKSLPRGSDAGPGTGFDALVTRISSDVRPRAVLDELVRLGIAEEVQEDGIEQVRLLAPGFAPRQGFSEMAQMLRDSLYDHLAASTQNIDGNPNFLEQSIFVDEITAESAQRLHAVSAKAWRQAFKTVMQEAATRHAEDAQNATLADRTHRARFGSYFYAEETPHVPRPAPRA